MTKNLVILGSTGSIGRQTLDVADGLPVRVLALTAGSNAELMERQCRKYRPELAVMADEAAAEDLKNRLADTDVRVLSGGENIIKAAELPGADTVITAIVGCACLKPTLAAVRQGKRIGLANKETMVCAGELVMAEAARCGAEIIPVDSEHSAIFQCLAGCRSGSQVKRLLLTCSGGPFFGKTRDELADVKASDALKHPNWKMGAKITIDCATLMNKGLEVIEAMRLYRMRPEDITVVIHRQSIVHSLVEYADGAVLAQLGVPDMRIPIQLALTWPDRTVNPAPGLDLFGSPALTFDRPDTEAFPCLAIALEAAKRGGTACPAMNGANEAAVSLYLQGKTGFYDIPRLVRGAMDADSFVPQPDLEQILAADKAARDFVFANYVR